MPVRGAARGSLRGPNDRPHPPARASPTRAPRTSRAGRRGDRSAGRSGAGSRGRRHPGRGSRPASFGSGEPADRHVRDGAEATGRTPAGPGGRHGAGSRRDAWRFGAASRPRPASGGHGPGAGGDPGGAVRWRRGGRGSGRRRAGTGTGARPARGGAGAAGTDAGFSEPRGRPDTSTACLPGTARAGRGPGSGGHRPPGWGRPVADPATGSAWRAAAFTLHRSPGGGGPAPGRGTGSAHRGADGTRYRSGARAEPAGARTGASAG